MKPKLVVTHWVHDEVINKLEKTCRVTANLTKDSWDPDRLLDNARDADALMVFMPDSIDENFLNACPSLKVIGAALKGYDNFDVEACTRRGVWFTNVPDLLTVPTAELALGLLIGLTRNIPAGDRLIRSGGFQGWRPVLYGTGLTGRTAGFIGMGAVGRALAKRLAGFDMELIYHDAKPFDEAEEKELGLTRRSLDDVIATSDFLFPLVHLTDHTFHLIGENEIARMKPGSFLINVARGSLVDEMAVARALESGHLKGYAADVFEMEDWALPGRPNAIPDELLENCEQTLFTPHIGSAVDEVRLQIAMEAADNILDVFQGRTPRGAVNFIG